MGNFFEFLSQNQEDTPIDKEKERKPITIEIIDDNDPQNLLSDKSQNLDLDSNFAVVPYSGEGFAENPEKHIELANFLINKFSLKNKGALLDVGFGSNIHIANTFAKEKIESYAIDEMQNDPDKGLSVWHEPKVVRRNENGVTILSGDIADLGNNESEIKNNKFGLVLFNGSWESGGNNWTVAGEVAEAKYHNESNKSGSAVEFIDHEKDAILKTCKEHLTSNGLIGIISSRYALHGAGYTYEQLPDEKLSFLDLCVRLQKIGAKKIHLLGITQESFSQVLEKSIEEYAKEKSLSEAEIDKIKSIREKLKNASDLPRENISSQYGDNPVYSRNKIRDTIDASKNIPEINKLARIDGIFAEF